MGVGLRKLGSLGANFLETQPRKKTSGTPLLNGAPLEEREIRWRGLRPIPLKMLSVSDDDIHELP